MMAPAPPQTRGRGSVTRSKVVWHSKPETVEVPNTRPRGGNGAGRREMVAPALRFTTTTP